MSDDHFGHTELPCLSYTLNRLVYLQKVSRGRWPVRTLWFPRIVFYWNYCGGCFQFFWQFADDIILIYINQFTFTVQCVCGPPHKCFWWNRVCQDCFIIIIHQDTVWCQTRPTCMITIIDTWNCERLICNSGTGINFNTYSISGRRFPFSLTWI